MSEKFKQNYDAYFIGAAGVVALALQLINLVPQLNFFNADLTTSIIIFLLALLCIATSIERLKKIETIHEKLKLSDNKLDNILLKLSKSSVTIVTGSKDISTKADELINKAQYSIKATAFSDSLSDEQGYGADRPEYYENLGNHLSKNKKNGNSISYISAIKEKRNVDFRNNIFKKKNVSNLVTYYRVPDPMQIHLLIIDKDFALIAFPQNPVDRHRNAIFIEDKEFVSGLDDWYDNFVINGRTIEQPK